jgi:hypothetical protein
MRCRWRARRGEQRDVVVGQVGDEAIEAVRDHRARRAPGLVVGPEHEVIDQQLRTPRKEIGERSAPCLGFKAVRLVDLDPWQRLAAARQLVAAPREFLLRCKQLEPLGQPGFTGRGGVCCGHACLRSGG